MIGLCAVIVSVVAVLISAYEASIQREWQRAAVWPFVQLSRSYYFQNPDAASEDRRWVVDTDRAGERLIFQRELSDGDVATLLAGDEVVLTERFEVSRDKLKEIRAGAEMAPKVEPEPTAH